MITEDNFNDLEILKESGIISTEEKNLRSKIDSINRNLEQLLSKKGRIEFEIKRQKKSLIRKREELKKVSKRNQVKLKLSLESGNLISNPTEEQYSWLRNLDSRLLQESNSLLEDSRL